MHSYDLEFDEGDHNKGHHRASENSLRYRRAIWAGSADYRDFPCLISSGFVGRAGVFDFSR